MLADKYNDLQGWPAATVAPWNVGKVGDNETMAVGCLTLQADAVSAGAVWVQYGCGINAHVYLVVLGLDEALLLRLLLVDVGNKAIFMFRLTLPRTSSGRAYG